MENHKPLGDQRPEKGSHKLWRFKTQNGWFVWEKDIYPDPSKGNPITVGKAAKIGGHDEVLAWHNIVCVELGDPNGREKIRRFIESENPDDHEPKKFNLADVI